MLQSEANGELSCVYSRARKIPIRPFGTRDLQSIESVRELVTEKAVGHDALADASNGKSDLDRL